MQLTLFELANYLLILILAGLIIRYFWIVLILHEEYPASWRYGLKRGAVDKAVKRLKRGYADEVRFFNWWLVIKRLNEHKVPGVFVEVGVYKGESAAILHAMDTARVIHLFDTFCGFPADDLAYETGEAATYTTAHFSDTSAEAVFKKIGGGHNVIIHPGYFPESIAGFCDQVALVNLDADLYKPTKAGLEHFYPLLAPGGTILVHDYDQKWPGIIRAVDEFVATIPENMILLPDMNGTAIIIRNKY